MPSIGDLVAQERHGLIGVTDDKVAAAVVVEIAQGRASSHVCRAEIGPTFVGDDFEARLARFVAWLVEIAEQDWRLLERAGQLRKAEDVALGDKQVFRAVEIEIEKDGA